MDSYARWQLKQKKSYQHTARVVNIIKIFIVLPKNFKILNTLPKNVLKMRFPFF